jgi:uncharacterized protein YcbK (DUF882 family)
MYKCKHFSIKELVPKDIYELRVESACWELFDSGLLRVIDRLRDNLKRPITVNTWHVGGKFSQRGYRNAKVGASKSMHIYGKALDFDVKGMSANAVRKHITDNYHLYPEIRRMETDINWVHIDTKETGVSKLITFKP